MNGLFRGRHGHNINQIEEASYNYPKYPVGHGRVQVTRATYGANCNRNLEGNASLRVFHHCRHHTRCVYHNVGLGDPARGCGKEFEVCWKCHDGGQARCIRIPGESLGRHVVMNCARM